MAAKVFSALAIGVVVVAGIACGQGSGSPKPNNPAPLARPNPITVTEHLDTNHSTAAIIDSTGGKLTVRGADGVTYTLTIPANAMPSSAEVRMTSIASLDGMPWQGGLLAGVHIEPDGLQLLRPAVLVADGVRPAPGGTNPTGLMYEGSGIDFRLYPLDASQPTRFQFHLIGFSSPGVGGASKQDITSQSQRRPCTPLQQLQQEVALATNSFRQQQLTGQIPQDALLPPELIADLQRLLDAFRNNVVAPEIDRAVTSGATIEDFDQAYGDLQFWRRQADLLNLHAELYGALHARLFLAAKGAFRDGVNRCFMHDVLAGIMAWRLLRNLALTNAGIDLPLDPIDRCLRFKLDFETQHQLTTAQATATMTMKSTVQPLSMDAGGSGPLNATFVFLATGPCPTSGSAEPKEEFKVLQFFAIYKRLEDPNQWPVPGKTRPTYVIEQIDLHMTPGKANEVFTFACPAPVGTQRGVCAACYEHDWAALHMDENVGQYFSITGWTITNGQHLFAHKDYPGGKSYRGPGATIKELKTTFDLWHEPVGSGMP